MVELSVGEVSGLVAAGVFLVQIFFPLAISAILIAFVSEENNLVTWSVLGRYLHSTFWPTILSTDAAADTAVRRRVFRTGWVQTIALILVSVASIVTPLGLYDVVEPPKLQTNTPFTYIEDHSAFGYGTPPRSDAPFTRVCEGTKIACPGTTRTDNCTTKGFAEVCTVDYDVRIPDDLKELFRDGPSSFGATVSSIFDIQWRSYKNALGSMIGPYLEPASRQLALLVLDDTVKPYEGLIVDMKEGGIGFRNHTIPRPTYQYGSTWDEDILFVEPETQCVNTNLTLDFTLPDDDTSHDFVEKLFLTDRGGFSGLARTSPNYAVPPNGQDINLRERAYKAAWLNNFYTMVYFNITDFDRTNITRIDTVEGSKYPIRTDETTTKFRVSQDVIRASMIFGQYLNLDSPLPGGNASQSHINPFNISSDFFQFVTTTCAGTSPSSPPNINGSVVGCALLYGAAKRTDGGSSLVFDPRSTWSTPIYSCATAVKATIRTTSFQYNGTTLSSLTINETHPKSYPEPSNLPLWGVEDLKAPLTMEGTSPLWGILGQANTTLPPTPYNISTIAASSLYLPGYLDWGGSKGLNTIPIVPGQNLPGTNFYAQALKNALTITKPGGTISESKADNGWNGGADFSGYTSLALFAKWQQLSRTPEDAAKIINLIWTDVSANTVVGTKGWGLTSAAAVARAAKVGARADPAPLVTEVEVPIIIYKMYIRYRIPFAVPAFLVLGLTVTVLIALIVLLISGRTGPKLMRRFLEDISVGRAMGVLLWPEKKRGLGTEEWIESVGTRRVRIGREGIAKEEESLVGGEERKSGEWRGSGEGGETRKRVVVEDVGEVGDGDNGV
ncbi:hypothetical protein V499_02774 [Pseudogymnoascus sp. VKM F-103]|uniref:Uncharacterized protein n=1 Tax=Pseudogymnoascus verrucosus TaxID=342668 RepID=A0A2P2SX79_9PEZI|nr:uncharacterized protein VE01_00079 [Pseudogymnoascus verrucosus]KFY77961.1 hypothetical protein V499_02774 [Pseudogymnoascus sp. VKM F-103]OBU01454.2 hypothetical protein VE01_00079 [Pseudogymnoascus verrucosus]